MSYSDTVVARADASVDDEFEQQMLHRSSTVTVTWMSLMMLTTAAVLSWALEGPATLWTVLIPIPMLLALWRGQLWLRRTVPTPRPVPLSGAEWMFLGVILIVWLAGISVRGFDMSPVITLGGAFGALVGLLVAMALTNRIPRRQRTRDIRRLDAEAEAEFDDHRP